MDLTENPIKPRLLLGDRRPDGESAEGWNDVKSSYQRLRIPNVPQLQGGTRRRKV